MLVYQRVAIPDAPWCWNNWNMNLQNWAPTKGVNVGKYSSTMEHLGIENDQLIDNLPIIENDFGENDSCG